MDGEFFNRHHGNHMLPSLPEFISMRGFSIINYNVWLVMIKHEQEEEEAGG
jgi:hypothetical protein